MAVLRQQRVYIHQLFKNGMLQENEELAMLEKVDMKMRQMYRKGPQWKQPLASEVLQRVDFMANVSEVNENLC